MALTKMDSGSKQIENVSLIASGGEHQEIKFGVKAEDIWLIMDRMTELYPNPDESAFREGLSNCIDATVLLPREERLPIKVTTPTPLRPTLVLEDFGVGMSMEILNDVYCNFGSSTKRFDFGQIGSKGLGAKAPLAYCEEFFLVTTRDGITVEAVVKRTSEGPVLKPLSVKETGAHSGTKITLPVKAADIHKFTGYMNNYSTFSADEYELELNGKLIQAKNDDYIYLENFLLDEDDKVEGRLWVKRDYLAQDALYNFTWGRPLTPEFVLSGWRYASDRGFYSSNAVLELKPGVLEFIASRDSIKFDDRYHTLMGRFNKHYSKPTKELLSAVMESYRALDSQRALSFLVNAKERGYLEIAKDGAIKLSVTPQNGTGSIGKVSLDLTLDDFTLDNGGNPMRVLVPSEDTAHGVITHFTMGDEEGDRTFNLHSVAVSTEKNGDKMSRVNWDRIAEQQRSILTSVVNGASSTIEDAIRAQLGMTYMPKSSEGPYIIHGVTEEFATEFLRRRRILERHGLGDRSVFFVKDEITKENLAEAESILGEFTQVSTEEFTNGVLKDALKAEKKRRKELAEERAKNVETRTVQFYPGGTINKSLSNFKENLTAEGNTVDAIMESESVLIICPKGQSSYWRSTEKLLRENALSVLYGAMNLEGNDLMGKELYLVEAQSLNAKEYDALSNYPYVYLHQSAKYNCNAFMKMQKNRVRNSNFLLSSIEKKRGEMLGALILQGVHYDLQWVKRLGDYLGDYPEAHRVLKDAKEAGYNFDSAMVEDEAFMAHFSELLGEESMRAVSAINGALTSATEDLSRSTYVKAAFSNGYYYGADVHSGPIFEFICQGIAQDVLDAQGA